MLHLASYFYCFALHLHCLALNCFDLLCLAFHCLALMIHTVRMAWAAFVSTGGHE